MFYCTRFYLSLEKGLRTVTKNSVSRKIAKVSSLVLIVKRSAEPTSFLRGQRQL
jgi:hypothetical protein